MARLTRSSNRVGGATSADIPPADPGTLASEGPPFEADVVIGVDPDEAWARVVSTRAVACPRTVFDARSADAADDRTVFLT